MNQDQLDLMKSGLICDFIIDVDNGGFTYGMINNKTGEKTVLIEDNYVADIRAGKDVKRQIYSIANLVGDEIPTFYNPGF